MGIDYDNVRSSSVLNLYPKSLSQDKADLLERADNSLHSKGHALFQARGPFCDGTPRLPNSRC
jgi:hypothetical protein